MYKLLLLLFLLKTTKSQHPRVQTTLGHIIGRLVPTGRGANGVYTFRGIPYAQPPIDLLRWKPPRAKREWNGILTAQHSTRSCAQPGRLMSTSKEDCLYLDIFTPKLNQTANYPVMVFLLGNDYGFPDRLPEEGIISNLVSRNVLVIFVNYRLGPFGFLSTKENENFALMDQILALKFIKQHVLEFGGDKDKITLVGSGLGAICTSLLSVSKQSQGLFHSMILQSGSRFHPLVLNKEQAYNSSSILAANLNCGGLAKSLTEESVECLRKTSTLDILRAASEIGSQWYPVLRNSHIDYNLKIPAIVGINKEDWGYFALGSLFNNQSYLSTFTYQTFKSLIPEVLRYYPTNVIDKLTKLVNLIYLDDQYVHESSQIYWFDRYIKLQTESKYAGPAYREIVSLTNSVPVFFYQFDYVSSAAMPTLPWKGVIHGSELQYLFGNPGGSTVQNLNFRPTTDDWQMANIFGQLWTNFAKYGNPTPNGTIYKWESVTIGSERNNYLSLTRFPTMTERFSPRAVDFWATLVPNTNFLSPQKPMISTCYSAGYVLGTYLNGAIAIVLIVTLVVLVIFCCVYERQKRGIVHISRTVNTDEK